MTWGIFKEDSVSEAYKKMKAEELKGKQHKLDVNKNGKIDGEDLAKLRKEETELDESVAKVAQAHGFQKGSGINKGSYVHPKTGHTITALSNDQFGHSAKDGKTISSFKAAKDLESHLAKHGYTKESVDESVNKSDIPAYKRKDDKLTLADLEKERTKNKSHSVQLAKNNGTQKEEAEVSAEELVEYEAKDGVYKHQAKAGRYGGSEKESEYVKGPSDSELKKIEAEKKKKVKEETDRLTKEEVEQIDEISLDTMKSAKEKLSNKAFQAHMDDNKHGAQHYAGRAMDMKKKIAQKERQVTKEEVEQLDELSPSALKAYVNKAKPEVKNAKAERQSARDGGDGKGANDAYQLAKKRTAGIKQAKAKLNKEGLDLFSEREIDMLINEVLKASDDAGKWISDFTKSDDPRFSGDSKEQRKKRALAAYYAAQKNESVDYDSFLEEEAQGDIVKMSAKKIKHGNIEDKDDEKDVMEPNSEGEADFLDKHSVSVTDEPAAAAGNDQSGKDKVATATGPKGQGAGKYDGKGKTGVKESKGCSSEDDSETNEEASCSTGKKKSYTSFKEKMKAKA
jgi:hypothetical protein